MLCCGLVVDPRDGQRRRATASLAYYCGVALATAVLFALVVPFRPWPFRVPFAYREDGLVLTALVKAVAEDGPLHFTRVGAPFGADFVDWGFGGWLIFLVTTPLVGLLGSPGAALNAYWLLTVVAAGVSAAWVFRRLAVPASVAFVFGVLYALLPWTFYRHVGHIALAHLFVPPLGLLCLRVAGAGTEHFDRRERWTTFGACLLQGLNMIYGAFFAFLLLAASIAIGWLKARRFALARAGALGLLLLVAGSTIPLVPSAVYWARHGRNPRLAYKTVADADRYGLKLRHLLLPIDDHPFPAFRAFAEREAAARFPDENENIWSRLGLLGSLGLVLLLGRAVGRVSGALRGGEEALDAAAALTVVTLLVAQVGGLGSIFNLLVVPDVRAYNRMSPFVALFAFLATAVLVSRAAGRLLASGRVRRPFLAAGLVSLLAFGVVDQVPWTWMYVQRDGWAGGFLEDEEFVGRLERELPPGAMVFQLPHGSLPVNAPRPPQAPWDTARPYIVSRTLRWSFGSMIGRTDRWPRTIEKLPPKEMVDRLALAGFSGIWVDRRSFLGTDEARLVEGLSEAAGVRPERSRGGRYCFFSLEDARHRKEAELGPQGYASAQDEVLARASAGAR
jgi:phosphoglycerol transferase